MKGKFLNVRGASPVQIASNSEITGIKKLLGLREKADYNDPQERAKLRYHKICIITDPDVDGKHILGLVINFLDNRFLGMLTQQMVYYIKVPIIRARLGKRELKFYSLPEVRTWEQSTPDYRRWKYTYFKGLGTSEDSEIKDDFQTQYPVDLIYDEHAGTYLDLAFHPTKTGARKDLIERYTPDDSAVRYREQAISHMINYEVIEFSVADVKRSIPAFDDGLKESQRKILYAIFKKWGKKIGKNGNLEPMKVGRLGPHVASVTNYHHGENSLIDAIVNMAQNFVGTNNLPYLYPKGQFGSRNKNGKDAAQARYTFTKPMWWLSLIFRPEDVDIMTRVEEEGELCEYKRFYPIIPTSSINGQLGIATGFRTRIPPHNPLDICMWMLLRIHQQELPKVEPWYRGFKGKVEVAPSKSTTPANKRNMKGMGHILTLPLETIEAAGGAEDASETSSVIEEDEADELGEIREELAPDDLDLDFDLGTRRSNGKRMSVYTTGIYQCHLDQITITELPIGTSIHGYYEWLESLVEKGMIRDCRNNSGPNEPNFTVVGMKSPNARTLRLVRSFGMSNMVLLDENNRPNYYATIDDLLETFYHRRLNNYQLRKEIILQRLEAELIKMRYKLVLIQAVNDGRLIFHRRPKEVIYADVVQLGIPMEIGRQLLKEINLIHLSEEDATELGQKIVAKEAELQRIRNTAPEIIWETELVEFVRAYLRHYPEDRSRLNVAGLLQTDIADLYSPPSLALELGGVITLAADANVTIVTTGSNNIKSELSISTEAPISTPGPILAPLPPAPMVTSGPTLALKVNPMTQ